MADETPVVRMYTCDALCLTWQQFFAMKQAVWARIVAGAMEPGDKILAQLIYEHYGRAIELRQRDEPDYVCDREGVDAWRVVR